MDTLLCELIALSFLIFLWLTCVFEAMDGLSGGRIRKIETKDPELAQKLEDWMARDDAFRAALKLLLFVLAAVIGALSSMLLNDVAPGSVRWAWAVVVGAVAAASVLSEIIARFILFRLDITILRFSLPGLSILCNTIFLPLTYMLNKVTKTTDTWHRKNDDAEEKVSVEDEILSYVESYNEDTQNDLEEGEKQMIRGILDLGDKSVHEIMTPRVDLVALPAAATVEEARHAFLESGHSRIPIYGHSIDEIRGILFAKDFIDGEQLKGKTLLQLSHKPIFVPETKGVSELLEEIKRTRNHIAVIIDEYGGTSGIITFEDIIEEIVGEVHDEYDTENDFRHKPQLMPDGSIILDARTPVTAVNDIADTEIPEEDDEADTIGGYICSELGRIPETGEVFTLPNQFKATILESDKRKIKRLRIEQLEDAPAEED